jgi:cell wall-associated NlpC family hydrolase
MQRRLLTLALFLCTAILAIALIPGPVSAATIAQKKAQAQHLAAEVQSLNTKMEIAVEAYDAANQKLSDVQTQIRANQHELIVARYNLLVARQTLTQRVVSLYKQDKTDMLDVLLSTRSFDQLVTEVDAMRQVDQSDSQTVSTITALKKQITERRKALLLEGKRAAALVAQRATTKRQVYSDLSYRQAKLRGVQKQVNAMEAAEARAAKLAAERAAAAHAGASQVQPNPGGTTSSAGAHGGVVAIAQRYLGVPYVWGGASPAGFDCSGLVMYCYAQLGISLPHNAAMQYAVCTPVAHGSEQPGDLVFFGSSAGTIHHVGIYVGGGSMIDAPYTGAVVRYDSAFSGDYFASGRP